MVGHLCVCSLCLFVLCKKLFQKVCIETSRLPVHERSLQKHRVGAYIEYVLQFLVCYLKPKLFSFMVYKLVLNKRVPDNVFHLVEFFIGKIVTALRHPYDVCVLINKLLEILHVDFVA